MSFSRRLRLDKWCRGACFLYIVRCLAPALVLVLAVASAACSANDNSPKSGQGAAGLALVGGDGTATSLALANPAANSAAASCLAGLSSDVVLPSTLALDHQILLIDRLNARLSWVTPADCQVVRTLAVDTGFQAEPRDVVSLSATKAYVTRAATNPTPGAVANDAGVPEYKATVERVFVIQIEGFDWNCPQHITQRYTAEEIRAALEPMEMRLQKLEEENTKLRQELESLNAD